MHSSVMLHGLLLQLAATIDLPGVSRIVPDFGALLQVPPTPDTSQLQVTVCWSSSMYALRPASRVALTSALSSLES